MLIDIDIVNVQTTKTLALTIWEILTGEYAKEKLIWMRRSNTNEGQAPNKFKSGQRS